MQRQVKGIAFIRIILWLLVVGSIGYVSSVVGPMYIRNYMLTEALDALKKDKSIQDMSRRQLTDLLHRKLEVNNIRTMHADNIKVTKTDGKTEVTVSYEDRANIISNLDVIASFTEVVTLD